MKTQEVHDILLEKLETIKFSTYYYSGKYVKYHRDDAIYDANDIIREVFKKLGIIVSDDTIQLMAEKYVDKKIAQVKKEIKALRKKIKAAYDSEDYETAIDLISDLSGRIFYMYQRDGEYHLADDSLEYRKVKSIPDWNHIVAKWEEVSDCSYLFDRYDLSDIERTYRKERISTDIDEIESALMRRFPVTIYKFW